MASAWSRLARVPRIPNEDGLETTGGSDLHVSGGVDPSWTRGPHRSGVRGVLSSS